LNGKKKEGKESKLKDFLLSPKESADIGNFTKEDILRFGGILQIPHPSELVLQKRGQSYPTAKGGKSLNFRQTRPPIPVAQYHRFFIANFLKPKQNSQRALTGCSKKFWNSFFYIRSYRFERNNFYPNIG
jgi:hypothetical protein